MAGLLREGDGMTRLLTMAKKLLTLLSIELLVPGGTLVVLALLASGGSLRAASARICALLPALKLCRGA
jgi:hypothetical protein